MPAQGENFFRPLIIGPRLDLDDASVRIALGNLDRKDFCLGGQRITDEHSAIVVYLVIGKIGDGAKHAMTVSLVKSGLKAPLMSYQIKHIHFSYQSPIIFRPGFWYTGPPLFPYGPFEKYQSQFSSKLLYIALI